MKSQKDDDRYNQNHDKRKSEMMIIDKIQITTKEKSKCRYRKHRDDDNRLNQNDDERKIEMTTKEKSECRYRKNRDDYNS